MVEERKITLLLTFSIANHCIPKKFEFPILPHLLPLLCIRCLEPLDQTDHVKGCRTIQIRKEKNVGRSSPDEQREDSKLLLQVLPTLSLQPWETKNHPEDPKTMKKMKVFSPENMGHNPKNNEGCGFPWKAFIVGLLTLPPSVGSWKTFHSDEQPSWITLLRFFFKVASVLGIVGEISSSQKSLRPKKKVWKMSYAQNPSWRDSWLITIPIQVASAILYAKQLQ